MGVAGGGTFADRACSWLAVSDNETVGLAHMQVLKQGPMTSLVEFHFVPVDIVVVVVVVAAAAAERSAK